MDRHDPDVRAGELDSLSQFLDYQRATMVRLVDGLSDAQLGLSVGPSDLTLAGLLKHLALVEDAWFVEVFEGEPLPAPWFGIDFEADPEWEFRTATADGRDALLALYAAATGRARDAVASAADLDALSVGISEREESRGERFSLRWILLHMIEETARHLGHADLIRQSIDGATDI